jgi:Fe2+ transport system protein FeoA
MLVKSLDKLDRGSSGEVLSICDDPQGCSRRLRRMGLREGVIVEVMNSDSPAMLRFDGCKVAVCRSMLRGVMICRCGCEKEDARSQAAAQVRRRRRGNAAAHA